MNCGVRRTWGSEGQKRSAQGRQEPRPQKLGLASRWTGGGHRKTGTGSGLPQELRPNGGLRGTGGLLCLSRGMETGDPREG